MIHWLIQRGFDSDKQYLKLISVLEIMKISHSFCTVIPFSNAEDGIILESEIPENCNIFCYGSYTLSKHAVARGYAPGAFISNNSAINILIKKYGKHMLNSDAYTLTMDCSSELIPHLDKMFVKPNEDTKAFTAEIMTRSQLISFMNRITYLNMGKEYTSIKNSTLISIASPKEINAEYRFFVVDGRIVTYSLYKQGGTVYYSHNVDEYIIRFAQEMVDKYQPDRAFVIDIAETPNGLRIIEINSINSSGLYAIDVQKLVFAINEMSF